MPNVMKKAIPGGMADVFAVGALIFTGVFLNHLYALEAMSLECILLFVMFSFAAESFFKIFGEICGLVLFGTK